ncbi:MAG: hypothetical protein IPK66_19020 [Rhodospirillales bacterium]|nr:hypothetical protein [Rhodospirillales bacterium]
MSALLTGDPDTDIAVSSRVPPNQAATRLSVVLAIVDAWAAGKLACSKINSAIAGSGTKSDMQRISALSGADAPGVTSSGA